MSWEHPLEGMHFVVYLLEYVQLPRSFKNKGGGLYFDDLIITGINETEHDNNLRLVLERAQKYNIRFNKDKIQFQSKCVKFIGQIYSKNGVKLNKNYVKPILVMPKPRDKTELLRILGMAKYLGKFLPNVSKITAPLRNLPRNYVDWNWTESDNESPQFCHFLIQQNLYK